MIAIICKNVKEQRSRENYNFIVTRVDTNITELSIVLESNANIQIQLNLYEEYRHRSVHIRRIEII